MVQFALNWPCRYPWMIFFASPCHPLLLPTHHHPRHRALLNQMHPLASYPSSLFLLQYSHSASEPNEHRFLLIVSMNKSFYFDAKFSCATRCAGFYECCESITCCNRRASVPAAAVPSWPGGSCHARLTALRCFHSALKRNTPPWANRRLSLSVVHT